MKRGRGRPPLSADGQTLAFPLRVRLTGKDWAWVMAQGGSDFVRGLILKARQDAKKTDG